MVNRRFNIIELIYGKLRRLKAKTHKGRRSRLAIKIAKPRRAVRKVGKGENRILKKHRKTIRKVMDYEEAGLIYKEVDGKAVFLETDVDKLLNVIRKRGKIRASRLARIFKVPRSKIEEWGIILEDHKLIEMHYPPFGEPTLMVRKLAKKKSRG